MTKTLNTDLKCGRCKVAVKKFINTEFGNIQGKYICLCEEFNINDAIKEVQLNS